MFTINAPQPLLTSPNGGEVLQVQCVTPITWNASTFFSSVRLDYSLDNGVTWVNITTSTTNDGTQNWTVPATANSTQCKIKISNTADLNIFDVSDATFTIAPPITVTSPNGGENWIGCATMPITFTKSSCISAFAIYYSTNNGTTWNTITSFLSNNGLANQTYNWLVPNGITSNQVLIKVEDLNYTTANFDVSNAVFNINPSNDITVTSPNGGQVWQGLSTQAITWTNLPSASGQYTLQYSLNNGTNWTTIVSNITGNSYNWSVPNSPSTSCLIKVIDFVNTCKFDVSNAVFTISPATPIVITPNGGESYYAGTVNAITWNAATYFSSVRLDYSIDNGVTWVNITTSTTNDGSQNWTVPNVSSTNCLVRVSNTADLNVFDVSNAVFTIKPAVTIITPNGDNGVTIWGGCTVTSITFDRSPAWSNYVIEYSINNGSTWTTITNSWSTSSNPATYNWSIPNTPTTQALVRVTPSSTSFSDASDNVFTITKPVTIIQPNFGGIMQIGTNYNIMWQSDGISNLYDIFYSTNGGASFTNIVTGYNTSNNTYSWLVPATASNNCRILVRDNINSCKADTSDIAFIISPTAPAITLTSPNGIADTLYGCQTKTITWTETTAIGTYNLAYSLNGGNTWINIVTNYSTATGTYNWIVPNTINSSAVLLRVQSAGNPSTVFDLSNAYFTILNGNLVATPAFTSVCSSVPVQLNATGGSNYSWSPASGLNNPNIANPIATPSSTTTYIVQSNNSGCVLSDTVVVQITTGGTTASVNITSSPIGTICAGTPVTFTANGQNTGTSPTYTWKLNGITVGSNSTSYTSSTLNNNDVVTCIMVSNLPCVAGSPATSNAITMSVSPLLTPSVSVQTNPGTTICQGTNVSFTAIPVNGGSSPAYQWKLNGANVGSGGNTYSNAGLNNSDVITVVLTSNATCLSQSTGNSSDVVMTVNPIPSTAGNIIGSTTQCVGTSVTYSVANIAGASSYEWTLPSGWSGNSTTNSITTVVGANGGNISVSGVNSCGTGGAQSINVSVNTAPAVPISISGNLNVCAASQQTYSVAPVSGASSYTWTLPLGWTGSSTSNTIDVNTGTTSGNITVTANNSCGNSAPQSIAVNVGSVPPISSPIAGATSVCAGTSQTYSVNPVAGATSYNWTLPSGWTGSSTTNNITTTAGSSGGNISVTASFACGVSLPQTLAVSVLFVPVLSGTISGSTNVCNGAQATFSIASVNGATNYNWTAPAGWAITNNNNSAVMTAGTSSGNIGISVSNACGVSNTLQLAVTVSSTPAQPGAISGSQSVCSGSTNTYSIATVSGASSYTWNLPAGWTGTSNSNTINAIAGLSSGNITVTANNSCGNSAPQSIAVNVGSVPPISSPIAGATSVCAGTSQTYSVNPVAGATSYNWTLPSGWTGSSTTNNITTTAGSSGGNISVTASFACGVSLPQTLAVSVLSVPVLSGTISGSTNVCSGAQATFSITSLNGATNYNWTAPAGWAITNNNNSAVMTAGSASGNVTINVDNACGVSNTLQLAVTVSSTPAQPGAISGSQSVCSGSTNTYSIATVSGASSYTWNLPAGWTGTSNSNTINAIAGLSSGNITVTANNSCGNSAPQIINISSSSIPAVPSIISGLPVVCENATEVYSVIADPSVSDYIWSIPASWLGSSSSNSINLTVGNSGGQLAVSASNSCGTSSSQVLTIQVTNLPASPNSIIGSSELCAGNTSYSIPLVTGATSYEWILPSGWSGSSVTNNINVNASAGTGSIVVSALNTCGSSTPQSLNVTIHALPNVALDLSPINIQCVTASSVQLIGGTPLGGSYAGNTVGAGIFNPSLAGVGNHVIQYSFVDSNSCSAFAYDTIMVDVCIGVEDIANTSVKAYPNPGNGLLNIVIDGKVNTMTCEVYNAAGMMVKSIALSDKNNLIDLSEFANGFYLLKIQDKDKVETIHYIKQ